MKMTIIQKYAKKTKKGRVRKSCLCPVQRLNDKYFNTVVVRLIYLVTSRHTK